MNESQIELARHALGLRRRDPVAWRNHFVAGPGHTDYDNWMGMVEAGDAVVAPHRKGHVELFGGMDLFWLTRQGAEKALREGESLDPELRFPRASGAD